MKFSQTHEWVDLHGDIGIVGITDYAQKELGDIVYIELPKIGHRIKVGDQVVILESTKAAADVYSPVSGEIIEVNQALLNEPERVNNEAQNSGEKGGWLFKMKLSNPKELDQLLDQTSYTNFIAF